MTVLTMLTLAHAFDVSPDVTSMVPVANSAYGASVVNPGAVPRLRPANLDTQLQAMIDTMEGAGCTVDGDGNWAAGAYHLGTGSVTGDWELGDLTGGTVTNAPNSFSGTLVTNGDFGDLYSRYEQGGKLIALRDDGGFVAGRWARVAGKRGVWLAITGTCTGTNAFEALDPWYPGTVFLGDTFRTDDPADYDRVDRMGMPAIATAVITSKDAYNAADPTDDAGTAFVPEIVGNLGFLHAALDDDLLGFGFTPCSVPTCVGQAAPLVIPDTLALDLTGTSGFPNGRTLPDPVIDVTLAVILLDLAVPPQSVLSFASLPLNPPANDVPFSPTFPYLAAPN